MTFSPIGMFWHGAPLGFVERLCITSFIDAGHPVTVFGYDPLDNLPAGARFEHADAVLARPEEVLRSRVGNSPALFADKFRYNLLSQRDGWIWCDTDAYCLKPFIPTDGYFFGRENDRKVANGVMAVPAASPTLASLVAGTSVEYGIPEWIHPRKWRAMQETYGVTDPQELAHLHVSELPWGIWGPRALTYFLRQNNEFDRAFPPHVLYPVAFDQSKLYFRPAERVWSMIHPDTVSIHFYGRRVRKRLLGAFDGAPPPGSILEELARKHGLL
ncbi:MAG: hypothetical protein HRU32_07515 [Rhodobacteraceae bacterium]|nr:hypothetical protein [Paracoccaceae bacterium]